MCEVCPDAGPVREINPAEDVVWMTRNGMRPQQLVPWTFKHPERMGVTIADSSCRSLVESGQPRVMEMITKVSSHFPSGETHSREVIVFCVPGVTAARPANTFNVSTFIHFWEFLGGCRNEFEIFLVPPERSVQNDWGGAKRAKQVRWLFREYVEDKRVTFLGNVLDALEAEADTTGHKDPNAGVLWDDALHMTPDTTELVNMAMWQQIAKIQDERGSQEKIPLLIWDFNASTDNMKKMESAHVSWWDAVTSWASAVGPMRSTTQQQLNALVGTKEPEADYYKVNLRKPHLKAALNTEGHKARVLEYEEMNSKQFNPMELMGECRTHEGVIVDRKEAETRAQAEKWPSEDDEEEMKLWLKAAWNMTGHAYKAEAFETLNTKLRGYRRLMIWGILQRFHIPKREYAQTIEDARGATSEVASGSTMLPQDTLPAAVVGSLGAADRQLLQEAVQKDARAAGLVAPKVEHEESSSETTIDWNNRDRCDREHDRQLEVQIEVLKSQKRLETPIVPAADPALQAVKVKSATITQTAKREAVDVGPQSGPNTAEGAALEQMQARDNADASPTLALEVDTSAQGEDDPGAKTGTFHVDLESSSDN